MNKFIVLTVIGYCITCFQIFKQISIIAIPIRALTMLSALMVLLPMNVGATKDGWEAAVMKVSMKKRSYN